MIVYNVTIKIDKPIEVEWLKWHRNEHIPEVMSTGLFHDYKLFRLLEEDEEDSTTYVTQYFTSSIEHYKKYVEQYSTLLRQKTLEKWADRFIAFRSVMEIVN